MMVLILGPTEVLDDQGAPIQLNGPKLRALCALLALEAGRVVSTDRLLDAIYGENRPQQAGNSLQLLVSKLRQALRTAQPGSEHRIVTRAPGYQFNLAPDEVDALRFSGLVAEARGCMATRPTEASTTFHEALALWRGQVLADFAFSDLSDFATSDRVRLQELRLSATEDCVDVDLALGRHVTCVETLEEHVAAHPLRERAWGQLMLALYANERQAEALRAFQRARQHLGEELGIEPGPALCQLEAAVLAHDPSLARPLPVAVASAPRWPASAYPSGRVAGGRRCACRTARVSERHPRRGGADPSPVRR